MWYSAVLWLNLGVLALKSYGLRVKGCFVVIYGPTEGDIEERERLCTNLDRAMDRVSNGYRLRAGRSERLDRR